MKIYLCLSIISVTAAVGFLLSSSPTDNLNHAIYKGDVQAVRDLLDKHPELANTVFTRNSKGKDAPDTYSALYLALQREQKEIAELLLSKGANPKQDWHGYTPLFYASMAGYSKMIPVLVQRGDTPNPNNEKSDNCPLAWAKDIQTAKALVDCGADVSYRNPKKETPLHSISHTNKTDIAQLLLEKGANVNAQDNYGQTPLHEAARECKVEMAQFLLDHGADINACNKQNLTPLEYCVSIKMDFGPAPNPPEYNQILNLFISKGARYTAEHLVQAGDLERLKTMFAAQPEQKNIKDCNGDPLLICAILEEQTNIVKFLLQQGANANASGMWKPPALHTAVYMGNSDVVKMLLQAGADVHAKGHQGETALHWVAIQPQNKPLQQPQYDRIAKMLIAAGAELDAQAQKPQPDMWEGIEQPVDQIKEFLRIEEVKGQTVQIMAPLWLAYNTGDTPLHSACRWGRLSIVQMLLEAGAKVDISNNYGQTPLHYAVAAKHDDILKLLLDKGANPDAAMKDGMSAMQLAEKIHNQEGLTLLEQYHSAKKK